MSTSLGFVFITIVSTFFLLKYCILFSSLFYAFICFYCILYGILFNCHSSLVYHIIVLCCDYCLCLISISPSCFVLPNTVLINIVAMLSPFEWKTFILTLYPSISTEPYYFLLLHLIKLFSNCIIFQLLFVFDLSFSFLFCSFKHSSDKHRSNAFTLWIKDLHTVALSIHIYQTVLFSITLCVWFLFFYFFTTID